MKSIIFNTQEVIATLEGRKSQFRRVIKPCKIHQKNLCRKHRNYHCGVDFTEEGLFWRPYGGSPIQKFPYCDGKICETNLLGDYCPFGKVGDKIFVKETFSVVEVGAGMGYSSGEQNLYRAVDDYGEVKWKPARSMKQHQSRLTLRITDISVERLQDISEEDAIAEGIEFEEGSPQPMYGEPHDDYGGFFNYEEGEFCESDPYYSLKSLWNSTHKKPSEKFEANPWVFKISFEVVK